MKKIFLVLLLSLFLITGCDKKTDSEKFSEEYGIGENVFVYKNGEEIIKIMEHGVGIVYLGFSECPWCKKYVGFLNEAAKEVGLDKIYYYNIYEDRKNNTETYQKIVSLLSGNLQYDDLGNERIYVPNVSFHIDGEVIFNDYETSLDTKDLTDPNLYWTIDKEENLKNRLKENMNVVMNSINSCTECNL